MPAPTPPSVGHAVARFAVESVTPVPEQRAVAVMYAHPSGARLLHLMADDAENLFSVAFRTPPPDDTGLPHILEHAALCGSEHFPLKDPFAELLKTSLATFLNAFTYPDRTVYPCASMNGVDFLNLVRVYADAAFKPRLLREHFMQEGHHYTFTKPGDPSSDLTITGIVYNEMKGAFGVLDGVMGRAMNRLLPDIAYGRDSGGDPAAIPSLTYEQFVAFHRAYYHPANAYFFLYGDRPADPVLALLDAEYLDAAAAPADSAVTPQPRWAAPRAFTEPFPVDADEDPAGQAAVMVAWATNDILDAVTTLAMTVLDTYLLDHAASPLRKALVDSGLGEELCSSGYDAELRDTTFRVGLKGAEPDRAEAILRVVLDCLAGEVERGLDRELLDAAFHKGEIAVRRIGGRFPLQLMERVYEQWLYDAPPCGGLDVGRQLDELRRRHAADPGYFAGVLKAQLLDNPHRALFTFAPDPGYNARQAAAFAERMAAEKARRAPDELARLAAEAVELEARQGAPNPPDAVATLPRLARSDVSDEPLPLPRAFGEAAYWRTVRADVFANGLATMNAFVRLRIGDGPGQLPADLVDYMPLYARCMTRMGAGGLDYDAAARRDAAAAGGLSAAPYAQPAYDDPDAFALGLWLHVDGLESRWDDALAALADRWRRPDFGDRRRLKDIVLQTRVNLRGQLVQSGAYFAALGAAAPLRPAAYLAERLGGASQFRFVDRLADEFDARADETVGRLETIRDRLAAAAPGASSFVGGDGAHAAWRAWLERHPAAPAEGGDALAAWLAAAMRDAPGRQGWAVASDVAFVAQAARAVPQNDPLAPALLLLSEQLGFGYLWQEIRMKGGAYGANPLYQGAYGTMALTSYRDPHIARTLDVFSTVARYVAEDMDLSADGLGQAVIGAIKNLDVPVRPGSACASALSLLLAGVDDGRRRAYRHRLLGLDADTVRRAAAECLAPVAQGPVCVLAGRERFDAENAKLGERAIPYTAL